MPYLPEIPAVVPRSALFVALTSLDEGDRTRLKDAVIATIRHGSLPVTTLKATFAFCKNHTRQAIYEAAGKHGTNADIYEVSVRAKRSGWTSVVVIDSKTFSELLQAPSDVEATSHCTAVLAQTAKSTLIGADQIKFVAIRTHAVRTTIAECLDLSLSLLDDHTSLTQEHSDPLDHANALQEYQDYDKISRVYDPYRPPFSADSISLDESPDDTVRYIRSLFHKSLPLPAEVIEQIIVHAQLDDLPLSTFVKKPAKTFRQSRPALEIQAIHAMMSGQHEQCENSINNIIDRNRSNDGKDQTVTHCKIHAWTGDKPATRQEICRIHDYMLQHNVFGLSSRQAQLFLDL